MECLQTEHSKRSEMTIYLLLESTYHNMNNARDAPQQAVEDEFEAHRHQNEASVAI